MAASAGGGGGVVLPPRSADVRLKVVMIGDSGTGKSCLLHRYLHGNFPRDMTSTLFCDGGNKFLDLPDDRLVAIRLWDTAGSERFRGMPSAYFRNTDGFVFVFDICDRNTFRSLESWIREVELSAPEEGNVPHLLIANKLDRAVDRQVSTEEAEAFAKEREMIFIEASALDGRHVDQAFDELVHKALERRDARAAPERSRGPDLGAPAAEGGDQASTGCC